MDNPDQQSPVPAPQIPQAEPPKSSSFALKPLYIVIIIGVALLIGWGVFYINNLSKTVDIFPFATITPTIQQTPIDETANWKTYSFNNEFTFKYPPDWKVGDMEETCCAFVENPSAAYPSYSEGVLRIAGVYNESCKEEASKVKDYNQVFAGAPAHISENQFAVNPIDENSPLTSLKIIFVNKGNACYTLTYSSISSNSGQKQIFDQILSALTFL